MQVKQVVSMFATSQTSLRSSSAFGISRPTTRLTRDVPRRASVTVCSHKNEEPLYARVMRTAAGAAAAALILVWALSASNGIELSGASWMLAMPSEIHLYCFEA